MELICFLFNRAVGIYTDRLRLYTARTRDGEAFGKKFAKAHKEDRRLAQSVKIMKLADNTHGQTTALVQSTTCAARYYVVTFQNEGSASCT